MPQQVVYGGAGSFQLRNAPPTTPRPDHVVVDVAYTGLCGTDLHIYHGDMDQRVSDSTVIGHEMCGTVSAVGSDVDGWASGDRVSVIPLVSCGSCPACTAGHGHICHRLVFLGIDADGSLQQQWSVPAHTLVRLADDMPLRTAALIEPTAVAVHDVRRAGVQPGEQVVVVGGGPVGTLIALVAREVGADVVVVELDAHRSALARQMDLATIDPREVDVVEWVTRWTEGAGAAVAFEVSGAAAGVGTAVDVLATRGRLCLVAIHAAPRPIDLHRFFWRELTLIGARLYERADFERAAQLLAAGVVPVDLMISKVMPLDQVAEAFAALDSGRGVMKILLASGGDPQ